MLNFYDVFTHPENQWTLEVDIAPLFKNLNLNEQENNIDYFLDYFNSNEIQNLDAINQHLLFTALGVKDGETKRYLEKQKENWFSLHFGFSLLFKAFEKNEELIIKVVDYFNQNINYYVQSHDFSQQFIIESNQINEYFKKYCGIDHLSKMTLGFRVEPIEHKLISEEIIQHSGLAKLRALLYINNRFSPEFFEKAQHILSWIDIYEEKKNLEENTLHVNRQTTILKI